MLLAGVAGLSRARMHAGTSRCAGASSDPGAESEHRLRPSRGGVRRICYAPPGSCTRCFRRTRTSASRPSPPCSSSPSPPASSATCRAASACSKAVLVLLFRTVPADQLLGSLLAYRIIYYFVPFGVALCLLGAHELWMHRGPMVRVGQLARTWLGAMTPQASAIAVFGAGAVLLLVGIDARHGGIAWSCCADSCPCRSSSCRICSAARSASDCSCSRTACTVGSTPPGT